MTSVIVDYTFKNVFLTFSILQMGPIKCRGTQGNLFLTLSLNGPGCVN